MQLRWADYITPSTLQLAPLVELLLEPIGCALRQAELQLGLQEALVNAVRHGNGCDPGKCLRVRRIVTPAGWSGRSRTKAPGCRPMPAGALCPASRTPFPVVACF